MIPARIRKFIKSPFNFPAINTEVGPSAHPMVATVSFPFAFVVIPKPTNISTNTQLTIPITFFIERPPPQLLIFSSTSLHSH